MKRRVALEILQRIEKAPNGTATGTASSLSHVEPPEGLEPPTSGLEDPRYSAPARKRNRGDRLTLRLDGDECFRPLVYYQVY